MRMSELTPVLVGCAGLAVGVAALGVGLARAEMSPGLVDAGLFACMLWLVIASGVCVIVRLVMDAARVSISAVSHAAVGGLVCALLSPLFTVPWVLLLADAGSDSSVVQFVFGGIWLCSLAIAVLGALRLIVRRRAHRRTG